MLLGSYHTKETKQKISNATKGKSLSEYHKKNLSIAKTGKNHPQYGKPISKEIRKKISIARKGQQLTKETKLKMSIAGKGKHNQLIGREFSKEHKKNLSIAGMGRKFSKETRKKISIKRRHQVFPLKDSKPEKMVQLALKLKNIKFRTHEPILGQPDIFIEPNLCIFVDGDYWHANPKKYKTNDIIIGTKKASDIWARDTKINHELGILGYNIVRLWESDIINCKSIEIVNKIISRIA